MAQSFEDDSEFKVVMIGDTFVGKTSLVNQFYKHIFNVQESPTIAASFLQVPIKLKSTAIKLNIWDTAGHEKFHCIVPLYARTADALIVVFDVNSQKSFENAQNWFQSLSEEIGKTPVSLLCGNKIDLNRNINPEPFMEWARDNKILFELTSALTGENVSAMFEKVGEALVAVNMPSNLKAIEATPIDNSGGSCSC